jgi:hypothetical protein
MFPPDPESGLVPERRVRTVGRRGRPLSLVVAVLLFAAFWACSTGTSLWAVAHDGRGDHGRDLAGLVFWTLVCTLLAWRLWRGGRVAIAVMARLGTLLGLLLLFTPAVFTVLYLVEPAGGSALAFVRSLLPALVSGGALLTGGRLLRRTEVVRWSGA